MGTQVYGYTPAEHEYSVHVPQVSSDEPELLIYVSAHGGGTVGQAYAGNGWDYAVYQSGVLMLEGSDLRSPDGRPAGHAESARSLASFLSAAGEHYAYRSHGPVADCGACGYVGEYSDTEAEWLAANTERLGCFAVGE